MKRAPAFLLTVIVLVYIYNNFFSSRILEGTYVNRNYGYHFIGHISDAPDTLRLKKDYQFESSFYGKGAYKLKYALCGTKINLHYGKGNPSTLINGKQITLSNEESFSAPLNRSWFIGNPKIILFEDLNQYYEKIE